jgi:hypothetical protein
MLPATTIAVGAREIHRNPGAGEPVLERNPHAACILIGTSVYRQCGAARSRWGGRIGHCSRCRDAPPRRIVHIVDPARQRTDLRIDDPDLRVDGPDLRVDDAELRVDTTDLRVDDAKLRVDTADLRIDLRGGGKA